MSSWKRSDDNLNQKVQRSFTPRNIPCLRSEIEFTLLNVWWSSYKDPETLLVHLARWIDWLPAFESIWNSFKWEKRTEPLQNHSINRVFSNLQSIVVQQTTFALQPAESIFHRWHLRRRRFVYEAVMIPLNEYLRQVDL